jgi:hypothetical protein
MQLIADLALHLSKAHPGVEHRREVAKSLSERPEYVESEEYALR